MIDSRSIKKVLKQAGVVYNYINHSMHVAKTIKIVISFLYGMVFRHNKDIYITILMILATVVYV